MCTVDWSAIAAWVQAIGSIAAIVFAVKVGRDSDARARSLVMSERDRQSRIAANIFHMQFGRLSVEIKARQKEIEKIKSATSTYPGAALQYFSLRFSSPIVERQPDIYLFDATIAPNIAAAIDQVHTFESMTAPIIHSLKSSDVAPQKVVMMLEKHLAQLLDTSDLAQKVLRERFELPELPS